ncbi:type II secretion system protein [Limnohabitans sp.]|uniref:type II secretion system protein n=1 Tax=Limnohabitans sp. TaxID=1907725 RepID=UPI0038B6B2DF
MRLDRVRGFTLIELLVTLAIIATLSFLVVPVVQVSMQRAKEAELRTALKEIRQAIDAYKQSSDAGEIMEPEGLISGYPPNLNLLADGVRWKDEKAKGKKYFLRKLPRDPMNDNPDVSAADTWGKRCYDSEASEPREGADVYDVYSLSNKQGLNGIAYRWW